MPREKTRYRSSSRRRSTSESSDSSYDRHKSKSKRRYRSRSKDSESSRRRRRSRSSSRDRYSSKTKKSSSKGRSKKSKRRSKSRERSPSDYRDKHRSSKSSHKKSSRRRSYSSDSRSSQSSVGSANAFPIPSRKILTDDIENKVEQAIKAAEAVGLTMTKLPKYEFNDCVVKADMPTIHDRNLLEELNKDSFVSKPFVSSRNKKFSENIVIDLDTDTVKMPEIEIKEEESILKLDELPSDEELKEMWIKKLFLLRKKLLDG